MHQVWNLEPTNFTLQPGLDRSFSKEQTEFKIYITKKKDSAQQQGTISPYIFCTYSKFYFSSTFAIERKTV